MPLLWVVRRGVFSEIFAYRNKRGVGKTAALESGDYQQHNAQ